MFYCPPADIRVSVDVGCKSHQVAVGLSSGEVLDEFSIGHQPEGFRTFFTNLCESGYLYPIQLDSTILAKKTGYF